MTCAPLQFNVTFKGGSLANDFFPMVSWSLLLAASEWCFVLWFQSDFKLFTSPQDYGDKVIAKITEFNEAVDQVMIIFCTWQGFILLSFFIALEINRESIDTIKTLSTRHELIFIPFVFTYSPTFTQVCVPCWHHYQVGLLQEKIFSWFKPFWDGLLSTPFQVSLSEVLGSSKL